MLRQDGTISGQPVSGVPVVAGVVAVVAVGATSVAVVPGGVVRVVAVGATSVAVVAGGAVTVANVLEEAAAVHLVQTVEVWVKVNVEIVEVVWTMVEDPETVVEVIGQTDVVTIVMTVVTAGGAVVTAAVVIEVVSAGEVPVATVEPAGQLVTSGPQVVSVTTLV